MNLNTERDTINTARLLPSNLSQATINDIVFFHLQFFRRLFTAQTSSVKKKSTIRWVQSLSLTVRLHQFGERCRLLKLEEHFTAILAHHSKVDKFFRRNCSSDDVTSRTAQCRIYLGSIVSWFFWLLLFHEIISHTNETWRRMNRDDEDHTGDCIHGYSVT